MATRLHGWMAKYCQGTTVHLKIHSHIKHNHVLYFLQVSVLYSFITVSFHAANSYDMRLSTDKSRLTRSFENATRVDVVEGNLASPALPSETETFIIRVRAEHLNRPLCFGVKVIDSGGRVSEVPSMVWTVVSGPPDEEISTTVTTPEETTVTTSEETTAVTVMIGGVIVIALILGSNFLCKQYRQPIDASQQNAIV